MSATLVGCGTRVSDRSVQGVTASQVSRWIDEGGSKRIVLDLRTQDAFLAGHLPGARWTDLPELADRDMQERLKSYSTVIIYGEHENAARAVAGAKRLVEAGLKDVRVLDGGYQDWRARGMRISRAAPAAGG